MTSRKCQRLYLLNLWSERSNIDTVVFKPSDYPPPPIDQVSDFLET